MKDFKDLDLQELHWVQSGGWGRNYELRNDADEVVAKLTRPRWWSSYAEVDIPGNRWSFERKGLFQQRIIVKSLGTDDEAAEFIYRFNGGLLEFPDGRKFRWKQSNFWGTKWAWVTEDGQPVVGLEGKGVLRFRGEMSLAPRSAEMQSLALLVFLGWYLLILHREQSSSSAVVVTAG
jgi:hypothetical protein